LREKIKSIKCNNRKILSLLLVNLIFLGFSTVHHAQELVTPASSEPKEEANTNFSLTQSEIRNQKKWEVGGFGVTEDDISAKINYNLTSRFSIGYSHFHYKEVEKNVRLDPYFAFGVIKHIEEKYTPQMGRFHLRYYLFEKIPFYVTAGVGRNFSGSRTRTYTYGNLDANGNFYPRPVITDRNFSPYNFLFLGLGFQWIFQNGFFMGIEAFRVNVYNYHEKNTYTIFDTNYPATFLAFDLLNSGKDKIKGSFMTGDLWIGYAFSF